VRINNANIFKVPPNLTSVQPELDGCSLPTQFKKETTANAFEGTTESAPQLETKTGMTCMYFGRTIFLDQSEGLAIKDIDTTQ